MAPVSLLPGRARFECHRLLGKAGLCGCLEEQLGAVPGILEVVANPRTGRVLVRFDESTVDRARLEDRLAALLDRVESAAEGTSVRAAGENKRSVTAFPFSPGSLVADMALHALLPAPFDILLPAAATAFRR